MATGKRYHKKILGSYKNFLPNVALIYEPQNEGDKVLRHFVKYIVPILECGHPPQVTRANDPDYFHFENYKEVPYKAGKSATVNVSNL